MDSAKARARYVQKGQKSIKKYGQARMGLKEGGKFPPYSIFAKANLYIGSIP